MFFNLTACCYVVLYGYQCLFHVESCTYYGMGDVGVIEGGEELPVLDPQISAVGLLFYSNQLLFHSHSYYYSTTFEFSLYLPKFVILTSKPLSKDHAFSSFHSMDPIKDRLSPNGLGRGLTKDLQVIGAPYYYCYFLWHLVLTK